MDPPLPPPSRPDCFLPADFPLPSCSEPRGPLAPLMSCGLNHITAFYAPPLQSLPPALLTIWNRSQRTPLAACWDSWVTALAVFPAELQSTKEWFFHGLAHGFSMGITGCVPPPPVFRGNSIPEDQFPLVDAWLRTEMSLGRVVGPFEVRPEEIDPNLYISPIGLVPKATLPGQPPKYRTTTDLSASNVNDNILDDTARVSYLDVRDAAREFFFFPDTAVATVGDVESAFRLLPISPSEYRYLVFTWRGKYYIDTRLPFGIRSGPALYDAFGCILHHILERRCGYRIFRLLDDHNLPAPTLEEGRKFLATFLAVCTELGVPISREKLREPSHIFKFLGLLFDLAKRTVSIPPEKWMKMHLLLEAVSGHRSVHLKDLQRLCGFLNFASVVIPHGRAFLRRLFTTAYPNVPHTRWRHYLWQRLPAAATLDISWWTSVVAGASAHGYPLRWFTRPPPDIVVHTDASGHGLGAWSNTGDWLACPLPPHWNLDSDGSSTTFIELAAVYLAVVTWAPSWQNLVIQINCDNQGAVECWRKRGSRAERPMSVIRAIASLLAFHHVGHLTFSWLDTVTNSTADILSRLQVDEDPLQSHPELADVLQQRYVVPPTFLSPLTPLFWTCATSWLMPRMRLVHTGLMPLRAPVSSPLPARNSAGMYT